PWLCGQAAHFELAQRGDAKMLRIRRQGMRDPRLGLRRQGVGLLSSFRGALKTRTSDVLSHIGESRDSGFDAEPVIGPRFARTRWHRPGMTDLQLNVFGCLTIESVTMPHSQPSSSGLTGRPSIPETPVMESRSRGVLDP